MLEEQIILLLVVAAGVAIVAQRFRLPYTVALVVSGLALGLVHMETGRRLSKELVFAVFLPALLFEAAFHLDAHPQETGGRNRRGTGPLLPRRGPGGRTRQGRMTADRLL